MPKKLVQIILDEKEVHALTLLAGAAGSERLTDYARTWLRHIARLKREYALHAITAIPREYFKGFPGRPTDDEGAPPTP